MTKNTMTKNTIRPDWDHYFMAMAEVASARSTCPRAKVGAVLVRDHQILVSGYNGAIHNADHCLDAGCYIKNDHCMRAVHAEMNAIVNCAKQGDSIDRATLYVTHFPCIRCMPLVLQAGIKRICYIYNYNNDEFCYDLVKQSGCELVQLEKSALDIVTNLEA